MLGHKNVEVLGGFIVGLIVPCLLAPVFQLQAFEPTRLLAKGQTEKPAWTMPFKDGSLCLKQKSLLQAYLSTLQTFTDALE